MVFLHSPPPNLAWNSWSQTKPGTSSIPSNDWNQFQAHNSPVSIPYTINHTRDALLLISNILIQATTCSAYDADLTWLNGKR